MASLNKVFLMGNLCADVEIRQVGSGTVAQLRMAVNESFTTKPGEKVAAHDEHRLQLAAYAATEYGDAYIGRVRAINVFVSTTEPGRVEFVAHGDLTRDWQAFRLLASLWRYVKDYDPRGAGSDVRG